MIRKAPLEAGMHVKVEERGIDGDISEELSWTGRIVSIAHPWARVRDEQTKEVYERHVRNLKRVEVPAVGRRRRGGASVAGQTVIIFPPRRLERPKLELDIPSIEPKRRRRRDVPVPPPPLRRKRTTASRLSDLAGPSDEERRAGIEWRDAKKKAAARARRAKLRAEAAGLAGAENGAKKTARDAPRARASKGGRAPAVPARKSRAAKPSSAKSVGTRRSGHSKKATKSGQRTPSGAAPTTRRSRAATTKAPHRRGADKAKSAAKSVGKKGIGTARRAARIPAPAAKSRAGMVKSTGAKKSAKKTPATKSSKTGTGRNASPHTAACNNDARRPARKKKR